MRVREHSKIALSFGGGVCASLLFLMTVFPFVSHEADAHTGCQDVSITGTTGDDHLYGDGGDPTNHNHSDTINSRQGDDVVEGYSCRDDIEGDDGSDKIHGGFGNDFIYGMDQHDEELLDGNGDDFVSGGNTGDTMWTTDTAGGTDTFWGGNGNDLISTIDGDCKDLAEGDENPNDDDLCQIDAGTPHDRALDCEAVQPLGTCA